MVGDSQIGKTSLMVKYVEGSFDEDYIQTLGMLRLMVLLSIYLVLRAAPHRRQLHGEDDIRPPDDDHIFHMGFRRYTYPLSHS